MNLKALRITGTLHWGYSVKGIEVSKLQYSLRLPPPTTLIGALSYPLVRRGYVSDGGEMSKNFFSPAKELLDIVKHATFTLDEGYGYYFEDINVYVTLHFQGTQKDKATGIERRYLPKYRRGAILNGKIYAPSVNYTIIYILDENVARQRFGKNWITAIEYAGWNITRIGSKESIVSPKKVDIIEMEELTTSYVKTSFYFPAHCAKEISEKSIYYRERFWKGGFGRKDKPELVDYIIPGTRNPIMRGDVWLELNEYCKAYRVGGEVVVVEADRNI